jgi:hypothetical protein
MNELSTGWKFFRTGAIIQMILVILLFVFRVAQVGAFENLLLGILLIIGYSVMFWFLYFGLSCLNNNYPDKQLTNSQKTSFNRLFILNFLCIAIVFSDFLNILRLLSPVFFDEDVSFTDSGLIYIILIGVSAFYLFSFHILFLIGMYRLRILITKNVEAQWDEQFGKGR